MNPRNEEMKNEVYRFICDFTEENGYSPSYAEISSALGIAKSTVSKFVTRLSEEGAVEGAGTRHLFPCGMSPSVLHVPLIGAIACGKPTLAVEDIEEYIPVPRTRFSDGKYFALTARGDSMCDVGIQSGDTVIIKWQNTANDGDIVVALIDDGTGDGERATLKRFFRDTKNSRFVLHAENPAYSDIILDEVRIIGVARSVLHSL